MVLGQHEATQLRSEVACHTRRQWRDHRPPFRRDPALTAITDGPDPQHQILNQESFVPLEARTGRNVRLQDLAFNADPWCRLATATMAIALAALRRGSPLHAAWFDRRPAFQPLQPHKLLAQLRHDPLLLSILLE